jgi:erythrocyte band 7 integral membrane protein
MSATDNSSSPLRKDKGPETNGTTEIGFRPQQNMTVQPPRERDLQPSYASIVGDDANPEGWYGSMSKSLPHPDILPFCFPGLCPLLT